MENNMHSFVHTNLRIFYRIAYEAYMAMNEYLNSGTKPKPDNTHGHIVTYDPEQKSFKNALVTIVFFGVFLESLLHLLIVERKGIETAKKYDRKSYECKLQLLGCNDQPILDECKHYREARREIVHEKAYIDNKRIRVAQQEAAFAMKLIQKIVTYLGLKID